MTQLQAAATSAANSIKATQEAMRLDQRAWVTASKIVTTPKLEAKNGADFTIEVVFKNTGKTPAKNAIMRQWWEFVPKGGIPKYAIIPVTTSRALVAPNGEYFSDVTPLRKYFNAVTQEPIGESFLKQFTSGNIVLYIHGRADYDDIFGCPHWTIFCSYLAFEGDHINVVVCPEHNDADENACTKPNRSPKAN